jgi:hypothetical protein
MRRPKMRKRENQKTKKEEGKGVPENGRFDGATEDWRAMEEENKEERKKGRSGWWASDEWFVFALLQKIEEENMGGQQAARTKPQAS